MLSLIDIVRNKFLDAIRSVNPPGRWKILVVDEHSQKLLGSVLKQFDILEENVTLIESITNYREPQQFEAVYLLMPTSQNVDRIIRDFSDGRKQYSAAHLFFIEGLSDSLFQRLTSSAAEPYLQGLKELFVNFWATEAQFFSLRMPAQFFSLYSSPRSESGYPVARERLEEDLRFVSKRIANVCIAMNEFPFIRYYFPSHHPPLGPLKPHASTRPPPPPETSTRWRTALARGAEARSYEAVESEYATKLLAFMVQGHLDEYKKANSDFGKVADRPPATLVITDRSMDMMAPFVHEFTYQAMANDLLPIEDGIKYKYKFQSSVGAYEDKMAVLSDSDSTWTEHRHMHMKEALDNLIADFNKFIQDNAGFKGEGAANLDDMKDMLANLPQYQEQREKFSLHLNMAQECMSIFERDKLPLVGNVEQNCATGLTAEGKSPKSLVEEMVPLLDSREVSNLDKVRIVSLYVQYREGVPEEDRRRLYQHARLSLSEQDAINALVHLGVRITRGPGDRDIKKKIKQKQKPNTEEEYVLSRFKPLLSTVLEEHVAGKLDLNLFPYVKDPPPPVPVAPSMRSTPSQTTSLRSARPNWHKAAKTHTTVETRQRILVFVAGGVTYSEVREAYQLSDTMGRDIYIGSTHALTPRQFIDDLKVLDLGGVGSKSLQHGLQDRRGGERQSFQEYYDEKYLTQDAPPPRPALATLATASTASTGRTKSNLSSPVSLSPSLNSTIPGTKEEKKKKKGLFRF